MRPYHNQIICRCLLTLALLTACIPCGAVLVASPVNPKQASLKTEAVALNDKVAYQLFFMGDRAEHRELFAEGFLSVVSLDKLEEVRRLYLDKLGAYQGLTRSEEGLYTLSFERGTAPSKLTIDQEKVASLWFGAPLPTEDQRPRLRQRFKASEGVTSAIITLNNREVIFEHNAHLPLSVGSAFKLYVLKALLSEVEAGRRSLNEVVSLNELGRSLPPGLLQDWPLGTPVTLGTLATLMISRSDNTATDHLIHSLGRKTVERHAPAGMRPFLTTREAFLLKWGARVELRADFEDASEVDRRQLLEQLKGLTLSELKPHVNPIAIQEIEWRASAVELCDVLWSLRDQALISINTGLTSPEGTLWDRVAFKGGSEPGVLSYAHLLMTWGPATKVGKEPTLSTACVVSTINHPSKVIDPSFTELSLSLIAQATQVVQARQAFAQRGASPQVETAPVAKEGSATGERPEASVKAQSAPPAEAKTERPSPQAQEPSSAEAGGSKKVLPTPKTKAKPDEEGLPPSAL